MNNPHALFPKNRYLKIMILPELGGHVQMALDKTNDYHFVYCNCVINPRRLAATVPATGAKLAVMCGILIF